MESIRQAIAACSSKDLEQRKVWYSPAAAAYNKTRPRYPKSLIDRVLEITQISSGSKVLEVGCGPGTATVAFAPYCGKMLCLEPNQDFYQLAQHNGKPYPQVEIQNLAFEGWDLETEAFDVVLAASSFHWIPPEVGYPKAAAALHAGGYLVLLWNKELQPQYEVHQCLSEVYQQYEPSLARYEDKETQAEILKFLGQPFADSSQFQEVLFELVESEVIYSTDDYLTLLTTYLPYLQLKPETRSLLFDGLRQKINQDWGGVIQLSYLSACHIAYKR